MKGWIDTLSRGRRKESGTPSHGEPDSGWPRTSVVLVIGHTLADAELLSPEPLRQRPERDQRQKQAAVS